MQRYLDGEHGLADGVVRALLNAPRPSGDHRHAVAQVFDTAVLAEGVDERRRFPLGQRGRP
jgi:hypothetical protein